MANWLLDMHPPEEGDVSPPEDPSPPPPASSMLAGLGSLSTIHGLDRTSVTRHFSTSDRTSEMHNVLSKRRPRVQGLS